MRCRKCGKRIGFNQRDNTCPRCGTWLLSHPPSEHMLEHMRHEEQGRDDFLNDFPWIGGTPGRRAMIFTSVWVAALVALALAIVLSFVTRHFICAAVLIFLTTVVATLPRLFLEGSRI